MQNDRNCTAKRPLLQVITYDFLAHFLNNRHNTLYINCLQLHAQNSQKNDRGIYFSFFEHSQRANIVFARRCEMWFSTEWYKENFQLVGVPRWHPPTEMRSCCAIINIRNVIILFRSTTTTLWPSANISASDGVATADIASTHSLPEWQGWDRCSRNCCVL